MARWVQFTAHIRIVPARGSGELKTKRFETWRDMQKIANFIYEGLEASTSLQLAEPGGGQQQSFLGSSRGGMSGLTRGTAVKPQMGETPAQAMISGYYDANDANAQPHQEVTRISGNETFTGDRPAPWQQNSTSTTDTAAAALKTEMETRIDATLPAGIEYQIFRLEYSGVIYGDRGYHFP